MTSSVITTFSGTSSVLKTNFFPQIELEKDSNYSCAFVDLFIHNSDELESIIESNDLLFIDCEIISGSYINGVHCQTIHQFSTATSRVKHQKKKTLALVEISKNLIYFPVKIKRLRTIQITILDRNRKPLSITSGDIICRIRIKRESQHENLS